MCDGSVCCLRVGTVAFTVWADGGTVRVQLATHPDRGRVRALDGWSVEAGEEGSITHRVTLSEDQRTRLTTGQLRVQPPDLRQHTQNSAPLLLATSRLISDVRSGLLTAGPSVVV